MTQPFRPKSTNSRDVTIRAILGVRSGRNYQVLAATREYHGSSASRDA